MIGILFNVRLNELHIVDIQDKLETYYSLLECDCIDMVHREIGGKSYLIVCDDEALLKDKAIVSAINSFWTPMLVGNLLVLNDGKNGTVTGLTAADISNVLNSTRCLKTALHPNGYNVLFCEYPN